MNDDDMNNSTEMITLAGITYAVYPSSAVTYRPDESMIYLEHEDIEGETIGEKKRFFINFYSSHENVVTYTYTFSSQGTPAYKQALVVTRFKNSDTIYDDHVRRATYPLCVKVIADITDLYNRTTKIDSLLNA